MNGLKLLSLTLSFGLIGACTPDGPSRARLALIEYTPDDTNADKAETVFTYFDSGFVDKIEHEVDGDEIWEELFNYGDNDQIASIEREIKGDLSYVLTRTFTYTDGRITSGGFEGAGSGRYDNGGTDVDYTMSADGDLTIAYNDQGLVTAVESNVEVVFDQTFEVLGQEVELRNSSDENTETTLSWNDEGLLTRESSTQETTTESRQDGEETGSDRTETEDETDYTYVDGVLSTAEGETTFTQDNDDTRTTYEIEAKFNEDGQLTDMEGTSETNNVEADVEIEVTYDEEGRISRLEDRDGNRWDLEYESTDETKGVTFHSDLLPGFIDLTGKQVMSVVGTADHLGY